MAKVTWGWKPPQYEVMSDGAIRLFYYTQEQKRMVQRTEMRPVEKDELPTEDDQFEDILDMVEPTESEAAVVSEIEASEPTEETQPEMEEVVIEEEITEWLCDVVEIKDDAFLAMIKSNPESLECQKRILEERIKAYDDSEHVNDFTVGGLHLWLDSEMRSKVRENLEVCQQMGITETVLRIGSFALPTTLEQGWAMYYAVLAYARASWNVTQEHYEAKDAMTDVEECKAFDWTSGYPDKLVF